MHARLRAEQARNWPRSPVGRWTEDMQGYVPLDDIPLAQGFGTEGWERLPPGAEYLPDNRITDETRAPELPYWASMP